MNRPKRLADIELQTTGTDVLVHDTRHGKVHVLNATAGRIFSLCDGEHALDAIAGELVREWGIDAATAQADVEAAVRDFARLGLLVDSA